ncbi:MAG: hypothetical protein GEU81_05145, partial [Nitriliruptorales bacterium]|nr:hypothetical protein [Nitriliruptorales bacterium]
AAAALFAGVVLGGVGATVVWSGTAEPAMVLPLSPGEGFDVEGRVAFTETRAGLSVDLDLRGLPPLPAPGVYEAWVGMPDADGPVSIGRLDPDPGGQTATTLVAGGALEDYASIWVTAEPDARDPAHDGPTVASARLPSGARTD